MVDVSNSVWSTVTPDWDVQQDEPQTQGSMNSTKQKEANVGALILSKGLLEKDGESPRNLVAFTSLGTPSAIPTVHYNVLHHFDNDDWSCVVFMYVNETYISNNDTRIQAIRNVCSIVRVPGWNWAHFLLTLSPATVQHYDNIAIVLDDVFAPIRGPHPISVPRLLHYMQLHNLSTISPHVKGAYWPSLRGAGLKEQQCLRSVRHVETFFQIFSREHWYCFHSYLHHANSQGFCLDLCMSKLCPGRYAVDPNMSAFHLGRQYMVHRFVPEEYLVGANLSYGMRRDYPKGVKDEWGVCDAYACPKDAEKHSQWRENLACHDNSGHVIAVNYSVHKTLQYPDKNRSKPK